MPIRASDLCASEEERPSSISADDSVRWRLRRRDIATDRSRFSSTESPFVPQLHDAGGRSPKR